MARCALEQSSRLTGGLATRRTATVVPFTGALDGPRPTGQDVRMPDKGPGSKGGAKKPKGGKAAATKNGKK